MQSLPFQESRQSKRHGHVPPKWSFWDLENSSSSESEEEEEVEEVLLPPLDPLAPFPQRASLLLNSELGDDLPGAKARKVMGFSTESWFEDSDDEEEEESSSSTSHSLSRSGSISFRNPFKRSNSLSRESTEITKGTDGWQQHTRGASLGGGEDTKTDLVQSKAPKRTTSFSSVLSGVTSSGSISPFSSYSPHLRSSPSPNNSSRNLLKFRSTRPSTMHSKRPSTTESDLDNEWCQTLDQAAKAAKWQTAIEHRPKQRCSSSFTVDTRPSTIVTGQNSFSSEPVSPRKFCSSSPALTKRLSQMLQSNFERQNHYTTVHAGSRSNSSLGMVCKSSSTPPRPPKSSLRAQTTRNAREMQNSAGIEYIKSDKDNLSSKITIIPQRRSSSQRQSTVSSGLSEALTPQEFRSPGLSASSSTTTQSSSVHTEKMDDYSSQPFSLNNDDDNDDDDGLSAYSPFLRPRKAPEPPTIEPMQGLGVTLGEWIPQRTEDFNSTVNKAYYFTRPTITRQESCTDPGMLQKDQEGKEQQEQQQEQGSSSYPNRSDRPASVPFSPPSAHSLDLSSDYEDDDFLTTLDQLDSNLELKSNCHETEWHKIVDIPITFTNIQHLYSDQIKSNRTSTLVKSPQSSALLPAIPCETSIPIDSFQGWLRYTEQTTDSPVEVEDL